MEADEQGSQTLVNSSGLPRRLFLSASDGLVDCRSPRTPLMAAACSPLRAAPTLPRSSSSGEERAWRSRADCSETARGWREDRRASAIAPEPKMDALRSAGRICKRSPCACSQCARSRMLSSPNCCTETSSRSHRDIAEMVIENTPAPGQRPRTPRAPSSAERQTCLLRTEK